MSVVAVFGDVRGAGAAGVFLFLLVSCFLGHCATAAARWRTAWRTKSFVFCAHLLVLGRCALLFSCSAAHVFSRSMRAGARSHSWSCAATAAQALPAAPAGMFKLAVHCALCAPWSSVCVRSLAVLFGVCAHLAHGAFVLCRCVGAACVLAGCVAVHLVRSRAFGSLRSLVPRGTASSVCEHVLVFALCLAARARLGLVGAAGH